MKEWLGSSFLATTIIDSNTGQIELKLFSSSSAFTCSPAQLAGGYALINRAKQTSLDGLSVKRADG